MKRPRQGIATGSKVVLDEALWLVASIEGTDVVLQRASHDERIRVDASELVAERTFELVRESGDGLAEAYVKDAALRALRATSTDWDAAVREARHLEEVKRGVPCLPDEDPERNTPLAAFDPDKTTQAERLEAKARQLRALGQKTSARTLRRRLAAYRAQGVAGLLPKTALSRIPRWGAKNERFMAALAEAISEDLLLPEGSRKRVLARARELLAADVEALEGVLPSRATQYKLFSDIAPMMGWRKGRRKYVQSAAARPPATYMPVRPTLPGERLELDSTVLDIFVRNPITGAVYRPEMSFAMDVATRTVPALRIGRATDHWMVQQMVLDAMRPKPPLPVSSTRAYVDSLGLGPEILFKVFPDMDPEARLSPGPMIVAQTVVVDQGKAYCADSVKASMAALGIAIEEARPGTPIDKGHVERGFGTLNALLERLPGYSSRDVAGRGRLFRPKEESRLFSERELETVIWAWVAFDYHQRPHSSLNVPAGLDRTVRLSPMDMYRLLVTQHGFFPAPVDRDLHVAFMDAHERVIQSDGIRYQNLVYHSRELAPFRNAICPLTKSTKWPIRVDPMDVRTIYVNLPRGGEFGWVAVPWQDAPRELDFPFPMEVLEFVLARATARGGLAPSRGPDMSWQLSKHVTDFITWMVEHGASHPDSSTLTTEERGAIASVINASVDADRRALVERIVHSSEPSHEDESRTSEPTLLDASDCSVSSAMERVSQAADDGDDAAFGALEWM